MKRMRRFLSIFLVLVLTLSAPVGATSAFAEQPAVEEKPLTQTLPSGALEGGHFDADLLKQWVDAYLRENYYDQPHCSMAIAFWYAGTDETWYYNADEWMYGVNWYKLPMSMLFSERLAKGEMEKESVVSGITLEYALSTALQYSSGPSIWSLETYLGEGATLHNADLMTQYADLPESYFVDDYYHKDAYTARLMMEITKTLYSGGEERFPMVEESMKEAQPEDFFRRDGHVRYWGTAQQHAAFWGDGAGDFLHCTGIIYTLPHPFILTIMSKNVSDLDIIGGIAGHFTTLVEEMNEKQKEAEAAEAAAATAAAPAGDETAGEPTDAAVLTGAETAETTGTAPAVNPDVPYQSGEDPAAADEARAPSETQTQAETQTPAEAVQPAQGQTVLQRNPFLPLLVLILILLILIIVAIILFVARKRREWERRGR